MSEFRADPLFGSVCLISSERASRPHRLRIRDEVESSGPCPLCPGNEALCPPEIMRKEGESGRWQTRVFANRYPALALEAEPTLSRLKQLGAYSAPQPGFGAHEVVVDSPSHTSPFWAQDPREAIQTLDLVRARVAELYKDRRIAYVQAFKNHRAGSGGSLEHPHFQLIALPFVPEPISRLWQLRQCGVCAFLKWETEARHGPKDRSPRFLAETSRFIAYADYAPSYAHQFSVFPKSHVGAFHESTAADLDELAQLCTMVIGRMERILGDFALNLVIHGAPNPEGFARVSPESPSSARGGAGARETPGHPPGVHWFLRGFPRMGRLGGFEIATSIPIVQVSPEDSARAFREKGI